MWELLSNGTAATAVCSEVYRADLVELQTAIDHAKAFWPGAPLIACRRQLTGYHRMELRHLDGATLKRLGFRAIADKAAQLPGLLREIEGHGATGELRLPEIIQRPIDTQSLSLPANLKAKSLRAAFDLVSSLHFIGDQIGAAQTALAGLEPLVDADRWSIYLLTDGKGYESFGLESTRASARAAASKRSPWQDGMLHAEKSSARKLRSLSQPVWGYFVRKKREITSLPFRSFVATEFSVCLKGCASNVRSNDLRSSCWIPSLYQWLRPSRTPCVLRKRNGSRKQMI